ncbi:recombinase family protein [Ruegeria sp.]|uniref:recombinase family protein n=1 Tax=Ruegeria sp. TaxID=1879320 RepID=UPI003B00AEA7
MVKIKVKQQRSTRRKTNVSSSYKPVFEGDLIGYARVSTDHQNLDMQIDALRNIGCKKIYRDQGISGSQMHRPGLDAALRAAKGNTLVVWRLDRLGRSLNGLLDLVEVLADQNTDFQSLTEGIDTRTSSGMLFFHIMAALSEFERSLISERTKAGLSVARSKGISLGRPKALSDEQIADAINEIKKDPNKTQALCKELGVSKRTMDRYIQKYSDLDDLTWPRPN